MIKNILDLGAQSMSVWRPCCITLMSYGVQAAFFALVSPVGAQEVRSVAELTVFIDGRAAEFDARVIDGAPWVAAEGFAHALDIEFKRLDAGPWAVCRGDLCIALEDRDWREVDGAKWLALAAVAEPLQLSYAVADGVLRLSNDAVAGADNGFAIGQVPPAFSLPDLYTGELVSSASYRGKKTFFFMWASW